MSSPKQDDRTLRRIQELEEALAATRSERDDFRLADIRWRALMDQSPFGIVMYRPDGSVRTANVAMQRLFALTDTERETAIAQYNILEDPQLAAKGLARHVRKAFEGEPSLLPRIYYEIDTPLERRRVRRWLEGVIFPIRDRDGTLREVVSIQADVSPLMDAQEELRRSQDELRERLAELELLYATAPVGLCLMDIELRFVRINEAMAAINGRPQSEHLGRPLKEVLPDIVDDVGKICGKVIATGQPALNLEVHGTAPAEPGVARDWLVSYYPLKGEDAAVRGVSTVVQDITVQKRAEEALKKERDRAQSYLDIAGVILVTIDADQKVSLINKKGCRLLGYSSGEILGENWFDRFIPNGDREGTRQVFEQLMRGELAPVEYFENPVLTRFGEPRTIAWHNSVLRDERGRIVGTLSSGEDITERKRAEQDLNERARIAEMRAEIGNALARGGSLEGILRTCAEAVVEHLDAAFARIWTFHKEENTLELKASAGMYTHIDGFHRRIPVGEYKIGLIAQQRKPHLTNNVLGDVRVHDQQWARREGIVAFAGHPLVVEDKLVGVMAMFARRELTETAIKALASVADEIAVGIDRKRAEQERRRLEARIQHAQKLESLGVLAGGIAHDFNNLLMAVLGNADLALLNLAPESPGRPYVKRIEQAAQRAAELTNQMLAYSGKGRFVIEPIHISRLVEEMGHLLETVISKKSALQFHLVEHLPAVEADASQIRQVVMNLMTNASEALGGESGTIRLCTGVVNADRDYLGRSYLGDELSEGRYVYLEVSDTGSGMDEETRQKIFDPFFTTKFTGRGLGLAAVLGIVRGHHGSIRVYSEPNRGTTFKVLLPASGALAEEVPQKPTAPRGHPKEATILVVDDDPEVLGVAKAMLEQAGYHVLTAEDGRAAVELFRRHKAEIALVVLDMTMPRMDGEEAFCAMRRIRPDARVILSSGYNEQEATNRFAGKGLAGFIQKPYRSAQLLDRIYQILDGS